MTKKAAFVLATLVLLWSEESLRATVSPAPAERPAVQLQHLLGTWEGEVVGHELDGKVTITISEKSLRFQGLRTAEWYEATFILQEGTRPQQFLATITNCERKIEIGSVVGVMFKLEDGTLSLAGVPGEDGGQMTGIGDGKDLLRLEGGNLNLCAPSAPDPFAARTAFHYRFRKAEPKTGNPAR